MWKYVQPRPPSKPARIELPGAEAWIVRNAFGPDRTEALRSELRKLPHWEYRKILIGGVAEAQQHRRSCGLATLPWLRMHYSSTDGGAVVPFGPEVRRAADAITELFPDLPGERNYCLANWYADGTETVDWHADNTVSMLDVYIVSVSVGASRKFEFRPIDGGPTTASVTLNDGDVVLMGKSVQALYKHRIAPNAKCHAERFNLTFRRVRGQPVHLGLATASPLKLEAVKRAAEAALGGCNLKAVEVPSGVPEQPIGLPQTIEGANNRLEAARAELGDADVLLAIESGLVELPADAGSVDLAVVGPPAVNKHL